jgi:hypothetical protein
MNRVSGRGGGGSRAPPSHSYSAPFALFRFADNLLEFKGIAGPWISGSARQLADVAKATRCHQAAKALALDNEYDAGIELQLGCLGSGSSLLDPDPTLTLDPIYLQP